jgi:hypothetical protein
MPDPVAGDVAVTWLGAAGCALYFRHAWSERQGSAAARSAAFLFGVLAVLLGLRGVYWLHDDPWLARLVFCAATLLPLAITLFVEHVTRRHHALWLKVFALGATATFFVANLVAPLAASRALQIGFLAGLVVVLIGNGWELLRQGEGDLSANERRRCRALVVAAVAAAPLVATDFRETLGFPPVRLGALGPLLLCYVLLRFSAAGEVLVSLVVRLVAVLAASTALAAAFAMTNHGFTGDAMHAALRTLPVAVAWVLLTAVFLAIRRVETETSRASFLRWLLHARLDSLDGFLASLRRLPFARDHIALRAADLGAYRVDRLLELAHDRREPLSLAEARAWLRGGDAARVEAAEQLVDLFERHGMTHALFVAEGPPVVVLLNLPPGPEVALAEVRAGVIQRLARRLPRGE